MPQPGFRNNGFLVPHFYFGGIPSDGSMVEGIVSPLTADVFVHKADISTQLNTFDLSFNCWKIFCNTTLTINAGGSIVCNGASVGGGEPIESQTGATGYSRNGSLGGSGSGGDGTIGGQGLSGEPFTIGPSLYLGGHGGTGAPGGIHAGGPGGGVNLTGLAPINSFFQPSVYQSAMVWANPAVSAADPETYADWFGARLNAYVAVPFSGGCGGGGASDLPPPMFSSVGGGGAGGGVIYIAADTIVMNGGFIDADGQEAAVGGGGGGGGVIVLVCNDLVWSDPSSSIHAVGGIGIGTTDGQPGNILVFSSQMVGAFSGTLTKDIYNAAVRRYNLKGRLYSSLG